MTYDAQQDARDSYMAALAYARRKGLLEGRFEPINADERRLVMEGRVTRAFDRLREAVDADPR
jgi:hypothetical protein